MKTGATLIEMGIISIFRFAPCVEGGSALEPIATTPHTSTAAALNTAQHQESLPSAMTAPQTVQCLIATNGESTPRFITPDSSDGSCSSPSGEGGASKLIPNKLSAGRQQSRRSAQAARSGPA